MKLSKYHIVLTDYLEELGHSTVIINTKIGEFVGHSDFNEQDDEKYKSKILGGFIAELRAFEKYIKEAIKITKFQIKTLEEVENHFKQSGIQGRSLEKLQIDLDKVKNELAILKVAKNNINEQIQVSIDKHIENRDKVLGWKDHVKQREEKRNQMMQKLRDMGKKD